MEIKLIHGYDETSFNRLAKLFIGDKKQPSIVDLRQHLDLSPRSFNATTEDILNETSDMYFVTASPETAAQSGSKVKLVSRESSRAPSPLPTMLQPAAEIHNTKEMPGVPLVEPAPTPRIVEGGKHVSFIDKGKKFIPGSSDSLPPSLQDATPKSPQPNEYGTATIYEAPSQGSSYLDIGPHVSLREFVNSANRVGVSSENREAIKAIIENNYGVRGKDYAIIGIRKKGQIILNVPYDRDFLNIRIIPIEY